jgi:uncharacterized protein
MPVAVVCPRCKAKMKAPDTFVGKVVKCPGCATSVLIPATPVPASAPAPASQAGIRPVPPPAAAGRPTPPPNPAPAPPPRPVVDQLEEVQEEVEEVQPAEGVEEVEEVEAVEDVEDAEVVEEDDLEVVGDGQRKKKKKKKLRGVTESDRTTAMLIYLSAFLLGIFGPLIIWLVKKDGSEYVHHHGKSALNFLLSLIIPTLLGGITAGVLISLVGRGGFALAVLTLIVMCGLGLYSTAMLIIYAIKAKGGDWSEMPAWIQFFQ